MLTIIPLPSNFITDITTNTGTIFTDLAPYIALILGVILGALIIEIIIGAIRK